MLLRALLPKPQDRNRWARLRIERLHFDLPFRWFAGLGVHDPVRDASSFSRNRGGLLAGEAAGVSMAAISVRPGMRRLTSTDHLSLDDTLIERVTRDGGRRVALAADRAYDTADVVIDAPTWNVVRHVVQIPPGAAPPSRVGSPDTRVTPRASGSENRPRRCSSGPRPQPASERRRSAATTISASPSPRITSGAGSSSPLPTTKFASSGSSSHDRRGTEKHSVDALKPRDQAGRSAPSRPSPCSFGNPLVARRRRGSAGQAARAAR